jgi:hypothetical protein
LRHFARKLNIVTNMATLCVAILVGAIAIKQYVLPSATNLPSQIKTGQSVSFADVDWSKKPKHLILALSTSCHFCSESVPFYKRLVRQSAQHKDLDVMAIFPQSTEEGAAYLKRANVPISDTRQVAFSSIPISGTPTILLVDSKGKVEKRWFGKLLPQGESEVMEAVGCREFCN